MQLKKLFDAQKELSNRIMEEHPELKGQDNLPWKILAFQVEVSELANEWRGFKMWSHDRKPRGFGQYLEYGCNCEGMGNRWVEKNPLLEEYADGLHFLLDIGLELGFENKFKEIKAFKINDIIKQFICINREIGYLLYSRKTIVTYIDVFELYLGLGEMLGFTWDEIEAAYFEKNKVNHDRQNQGY